MRRALLLAALATLALAATAGAHPLGNFTINHLSRVAVLRVSAVDIVYSANTGSALSANSG